MNMDTRKNIETLFRPTDDRVCAEGEGGMVAAAHPAATEAGVAMLRKGGNAADAAVAAALALCVCEPQACSIGGQSYALLHIDGRSLFLDGSGRVPLSLKAEGLSKIDMLLGYKGTSVPTTPLVLACIQKRFGRLTWQQALDPAIALAEGGYAITGLQHDLQERELENFRAIPGESGACYFLKNGKEPYNVGDIFRQSDLAGLLKRLAEYGIDDFYTGQTAQRIVEDIAAHGGFLAMEDLRVIPWPHERPVIEQRVFGSTMLTSPPPTQGRLLAYILRIAEKLAENGVDLISDEAMEVLATLFHSAYRIRLEQSPYPDLYSWQTDSILDPKTVKESVEQILRSPTGKREIAALSGGETTHLSVMDGEGNCAGITQSVNMVYGSKVAAEGLGFIYNNYLTDSFNLPDKHPHALVPGRTPPCSIAPFILMDRHNVPWMTAGSPGSQRIVTALALFLIRTLHGGIPMDQAMRMPRYHCQDFRKMVVERGKYSENMLQSLRDKGFTVEEFPPFYFGAVHAVLKKEDSGKYQGVAEIRRDGSAEGIY